MDSGPKGSEVSVGQWLRRRPGTTGVHFVGDEGEWTPNSHARFHGGCVAAEITKMALDSGWLEKYRIAFERDLYAAVQSANDDPRGRRWHVLCSYDPSQPKPPGRHGDWKQRLRTDLRSVGGGGKLQLIEEGFSVGDGVVVEYFATRNDGSLPLVNKDVTYYVVGTASERVEEREVRDCQGQDDARIGQAYCGN